MAPELLEKLRLRAAIIGERWDTLLRLERVSGPLAHPDSLVHLIGDSLREVFAAIGKRPHAHASMKAAMAERLPPCDCGYNPYLAYFIAGEQALVEALVLLQAELPPALRHESDIADLIRVVRHVARSEIDTFCGVCAHHGKAAHCRYPKGEKATAS